MLVAIHIQDPGGTVALIATLVLPGYRLQGTDAVSNEELHALLHAVAEQRDRRAFAELFRYFAPRLKGFGLRRGMEPAAADELVQETMLAVWRKAASFDAARATVATWVFTIVRNKRIDLFRREVFVEADISELSTIPDEGAPADHSVSGIQASDALREAMRSLSPEQLQILQHAYFEDKSHRAIANELRLPLGTVKSRIRLALARLRAAMPEGHA